MPLPPDLTLAHVRRAVSYIERAAKEFVELYIEQPNVFSAVVGILGAKALDAVSPYEKNPHRHVAASRFPDLRRRGAKPPLRPQDSLESKASKRPYAVDSHYDHEGWYIIWRYLVDPTESLGKPVVVWRVDCTYLRKSDWRYQGSTAGSSGGGRTHTFNLRDAKRALGDPVFNNPSVRLSSGKPVIAEGGP
jgi:hypothetical protein